MNRVVLVSDMHYTTQVTQAELKRLHPQAEASLAAGDAFGRTQREKIECVYRDVLSFHQTHPLDAVLVLGDLSIDDYPYRNLPDNYCEKFREHCLSRWPFKWYALAGNHDSYPGELWQKAVGTPRQYVARIGGASFVMLDTFQKLPARDASGAGYSGADLPWLREQLPSLKGGPVFLCAHHLDEHAEAGLFRLMEEEKDIVCAFRGHTHISTLLYPAGKKPLADIGGYGYSGMQVGGDYVFSVFSPAWAWGFEVLEWDEKRVRLCHIKTARRYTGSNGIFDIPETVEDEWETEL